MTRLIFQNSVVRFGMIAAIGGFLGCRNTNSYRSDSPFSTTPSTPSYTVHSQPTIRQDGHFTVSLATYGDATRQQMSRYLQSRAREVLKTDDIWLETLDEHVSVNYGHFQTEEQAQAQLSQVKRVYATLNPGPYQFFYVKEIPQPDPPAPAEWDMRNNNCRYSLEIGVYYDVPEKNYYNRKADAVKAVEEQREKGNTVFFYHGKFESHILLGCMQQPPSQAALALTQQEFPYHYENGYQVNEILYNQNQKKVRVPVKSFVVDVQQLN